MMEPKVEWVSLTVPHPKNPFGLKTSNDIIEFTGRWDYGQGSVDKMSGEPEAFIARRLDTGEESMVEMVHATFLITCSRVVSHELVRHRLASYQQESQRFVKYDKESPEDLFFCPPEIASGAATADVFWAVMRATLDAYNELKDGGVKSQMARYVLPNATRTRINACMGLREWRHVLHLRMHTSAQPEMQTIAGLCHVLLQEEFGSVLFPGDIAVERGVR